MRTSKILIATAFMFFTMNVFGSNEIEIRVYNQEMKIFLMEFDYPESTDVSITIEDESGHILLSKKFKNTIELRKKINMKNLPDGSYSLKVKEENKTVILPLEIKDERLWYSGERRTYFKPMVNMINNRLLFNQLSLHGLPYFIRIDDKNGDCVFAGKYDNDIVNQKIFNVSQISGGNYTMTMRNDEITYKEKFSLGH
ncbi:MAG: hypothetical protein HKN67_04345 [Saprospiraceae bacterium]|nr:hypothetical protein [Bacteroidia bacterium]MBT8229386.1 hypothetical protein [Bacteroidia bacterium]NNF21148.1 hypothetical protein [Saprospiraceae bacterium]